MTTRKSNPSISALKGMQCPDFRRAVGVLSSSIRLTNEYEPYDLLVLDDSHPVFFIFLFHVAMLQRFRVVRPVV
jgi:hypothetical protein